MKQASCCLLSVFGFVRHFHCHRNLGAVPKDTDAFLVRQYSQYDENPGCPPIQPANGRIWILFGVGMAFIGFLSFGSVAAAAVFVFLYTLGGIPVLIVMYGKIYLKISKL